MSSQEENNQDATSEPESQESQDQGGEALVKLLSVFLKDHPKIEKALIELVTNWQKRGSRDIIKETEYAQKRFYWITGFIMLLTISTFALAGIGAIVPEIATGLMGLLIGYFLQQGGFSGGVVYLEQED